MDVERDAEEKSAYWLADPRHIYWSFQICQKRLTNIGNPL